MSDPTPAPGGDPRPAVPLAGVFAGHDSEAARMALAVHVREADPADIAPVLALWARARSGNASTPDTPAGVERLLATDPHALLVAERNGAIVGALIAAWDGWRGGMYRLAVDPGHRRNGIATALVRAGEARLAGLGAPRITALVAREDGDAVALWLAAGYTCDRTIARFVKSL